MKISLMLITIDRYELTKKALTHNLNNAGHLDYELLVADNGSKDQRTIEYIQSLKPRAFINNKKNMGVAKTLNTLIDIAEGEYICHIANDILLPKNWLRKLLFWQEVKNDSGIGAIICNGVPELTKEEKEDMKFFNMPIRRDKVYSVKMFSRKLINTIGYYDEIFSPYGLEDSDFCLRSHYAGFINYYIPKLKAEHLGVEEHDEGKYREGKNKSLKELYKYYELKEKLLKNKHKLYEARQIPR